MLSVNGCPDLPPEISLIILEFAVEAGDGPSCAQVSKQWQSLVEPMIYRKIDLLDPYFFGDLLYRTLTDPNSSKPADFFARHVKLLAISTGYRLPQVTEILRACSGVNVLVNWMGYGSTTIEQLFNSSHFSPSRYSVFLGTYRINFTLHIYQNLTHLEILSATGDGYIYWESLSSLSNLTHLSVYHFYFLSPNFVEVTHRIIRQCPRSLRVLVNWMPSIAYGEGHWDRVHAINIGAVDPRAIVGYCNKRDSERTEDKRSPSGHFEFALYRPFVDRTGDWMGETVGKDFWELAEEIVERRREWLDKM
ncbi:hypothetical protein MD484_g8526, partial [Candolleomyces efflorescens]